MRHIAVTCTISQNHCFLIFRSDVCGEPATFVSFKSCENSFEITHNFGKAVHKNTIAIMHPAKDLMFARSHEVHALVSFIAFVFLVTAVSA